MITLILAITSTLTKTPFGLLYLGTIFLDICIFELLSDIFGE
jgi:hypothetical protein